MMSFCRKSVHSFLGLTACMETQTSPDFPSKKSQHASPSANGLTVITAYPDTQKSPNVLESSAVKSPPPPPPPKKDPGGIGFIDEIGGGVDGLMLCTESLGFESSDERLAMEEMNSDGNGNGNVDFKCAEVKRPRRRRVSEGKKFPPPLSSLNQNGRPSFFLRPVRKDGRLRLVEVRIDRPDVLRASRDGGRLRLQLVKNDAAHDDDDSENEENVDEEQEPEQEEQNCDQEKGEEGEENRVGDDWGSVKTGFRRCHELLGHHHHHHHHHHPHGNHHHHMHVWSQRCVTTS